jgi:DeoR/GlpR family transcriptional regulator of sugar metabolism
MNGAVRQRKIREMLESEEFLDLDVLSKRLDASESTVRRDLQALEAEGVLKRVYGGAMATETRDHTLDFAWQSAHMADEKRRIGSAAAKQIRDGETIILDGGSTVAEVARALTDRSLHVITNSLPIAEMFGDSRKVEVTLTGGFLYPRLRATLGPICEETLASVSADTLVMGIGGVTESGFSNNNSMVVGPQRKMIEACRRVIVVTDHTKFGHRSLIHVAPLDVADLVVTDASIHVEHVKWLRDNNVDVIVS